MLCVYAYRLGIKRVNCKHNHFYVLNQSKVLEFVLTTTCKQGLLPPFFVYNVRVLASYRTRALVLDICNLLILIIKFTEDFNISVLLFRTENESDFNVFRRL